MSAVLAHLAYQQHHLLPRDYLSLPPQERAFLAASDLRWARELRQGMASGGRRRRR